MSGEYGYIVRLLRKVEFTLSDLGRQREAGRMGQITQRVAGTDDVRGALRTLARVEGYGPFALRLLYYADTMGPLLEESPDEQLILYHVERLMEALSPVEAARPREHLPPTAEVVELGEAFVRLATELTAESGAEGSETETRFDELSRSASALAAAARQHQEPEIERFASSAGIFLRYAIAQKALKDVRVGHILEHAGTALSSALGGGTDGDSLGQTTRLLSDPATLLE